MIKTSELKLNNTVFVDEKITNTKEIFRGTVIEIKKDTVKVEVTIDGEIMELVCDQSKIYPIPLFISELINLGFTQRSLNTALETRNDLVKSIETKDGNWYLLELTESFLTIKFNGVETLGSGKVTSLHQLQNLIDQVTDGKIKI